MRLVFLFEHLRGHSGVINWPNFQTVASQETGQSKGKEGERETKTETDRNRDRENT